MPMIHEIGFEPEQIKLLEEIHKLACAMEKIKNRGKVHAVVALLEELSSEYIDLNYCVEKLNLLYDDAIIKVHPL